MFLVDAQVSGYVVFCYGMGQIL